MNKREFLEGCIVFFPAAGVLQALRARPQREGADVREHGRLRRLEALVRHGHRRRKCIGCNRCVEACKAENNVPDEPYYFRTWIERYSITQDGETTVECISTKPAPADRRRPRIPTSCARSSCPSSATSAPTRPACRCARWARRSRRKDGVVLVDEKRCIGCRYCIQACPYGARYLDPETRTADKCTFCYHRITKGLLPACVEVCPTEARIFGDLKQGRPAGALPAREPISVLKPDLNTEPKVRYAKLDGEVR